MKANKGGRPSHVPTKETRQKVAALTIAGFLQDDIAKVIGISHDSLNRHYKDEIAKSQAETLAKVAGTLVQKALGGDTASIIFYLKTRGKKQGWSERLEVTGDGGGPVAIDVSNLTDEQLAHAEQLIATIAGASNSAARRDPSREGEENGDR